MLLSCHAVAQIAGGEESDIGGANDSRRVALWQGMDYSVAMQASFADGNTPLWLNANKHGLSSLDGSNGYVRAAVGRPLSVDGGRRWGVGYRLDLVVPASYTSDFVVQQAYIEGRWLHGVLTIGSKEWPMELKNNALSSGSQTLGINARPVPQVRVALPDYWTVPLTRGRVQLKGHLAYGMMTDDGWQHEFTQRASKYADDVLYHSKAGYLRIGKAGEHRAALSLELGLEMACTFGGTAYRFDDDGTVEVLRGDRSLKGFWHALIPGGSDAGDTKYTNTAGNHVGSWVARVNYESDAFAVRLYADKFFEDHSAMLQVDYDGYGTGDEWNEKKDSRWLVYDLKDIMLGLEVNLHRCRAVRNVVVEYIYTKYQSGAIFHDHTESISDHIGGTDNYYNNYVYPGWQHWGQVIGNPLYRSPIYNDDGTIEVQDSRFMALHLGVDGAVTRSLSWRVLATWQEGLGTYAKPYTREHHNTSVLVEASYTLPRGWNVTAGGAIDRGHILGSNSGVQLTVTKSGLLGR